MLEKCYKNTLIELNWDKENYKNLEVVNSKNERKLFEEKAIIIFDRKLLGEKPRRWKSKKVSEEKI